MNFGYRVKEATQGYFHDFHEIRREGGHGGKSWIAPPVLIRQDVSPPFPFVIVDFG
jgi:ATPase complex subunit ATP10